MPLLTPESLGELWEAFRAKAAELTARDAGDPRAERVVLLLAGLPLAPSGPPSPEASAPEASASDGLAAGPAPAGPAAPDGATAGPAGSVSAATGPAASDEDGR